MLNVLFFAQTRELIGEDSIQLEGDFETAEAVREHLAQKGDRWALALEKGKLLVDIANKDMRKNKEDRLCM